MQWKEKERKVDVMMLEMVLVLVLMLSLNLSALALALFDRLARSLAKLDCLSSACFVFASDFVVSLLS
jgi:hypothetical protein